MRNTILVLSDEGTAGSTEPDCVFVDDREGVAREIAEDPTRVIFRAIALDRERIDHAIADVRWLRRRRNRLPIFALVAPCDVERAVELLNLGVEELIVRDAGALDALRARVDEAAGRERAPGARGAERVIGRSPAMQACLDLVGKAQRSPATALLQGETGTGKEVIARLIHEGGARAAGPFVGINCAAFPETLLESELFGFERGAFTGAHRNKRGHFESAAGGTIFLDEIGETAPGFQVKLLRVLQEGVVRPLGSTAEVSVDVRVIAATNRDLAADVDMGSFRRDLFYRLNVFPIELPPLRSRAQDIRSLAEHFLARHAERTSLAHVAPDAARLLELYPWPGNVRELENEIERVVAHASGESAVTARMLSPRIRGLAKSLPAGIDGETLRQTMARHEAWVLRRALEKHGGRRIATARSLGITRECLYKKLVRYGMQ